MDGEIDVEIRVIQDREKKKDAILKCESVYMLRSLSKIDFSTFFSKIDSNAEFIVASSNDGILGYAAMYANNQKTQEAYISLLEVYQEYQGLHIGKRILKKCKLIAKEKQMANIRLEVLKENYRAIKFYEKNGFKKIIENNKDTNMYMLKEI